METGQTRSCQRVVSVSGPPSAARHQLTNQPARPKNALVTRRARLRADYPPSLSKDLGPQQLRFEEPARNLRQDNRRETDHGGIDQQARTTDYAGLEKPVADEKTCMRARPA